MQQRSFTPVTPVTPEPPLPNSDPGAPTREIHEGMQLHPRMWLRVFGRVFLAILAVGFLVYAVAVVT